MPAPGRSFGRLELTEEGVFIERRTGTPYSGRLVARGQEVHYEDGVKHPYARDYADGTRWERATYAEGRLVGPYRTWWRNGRARRPLVRLRLGAARGQEMEARQDG